MFEVTNKRLSSLLRRYGEALELCAVIAVALTLFAVLALEVLEGDTLFFDRPILLWLHGFANATLDQVMRLVAWSGSAWLMVPLVAGAMWWQRRRPRVALYLLLGNGGAALLNVAAKHGFERVRPMYWQPVVHESSYSFPSGHAMQTMALVCSLLIVSSQSKLRGALAAGAVYVAAVGASRLYLGVHFPSDVLAGWCVSLCWCWALAVLMALRPRDIGRNPDI